MVARRANTPNSYFENTVGTSIELEDDKDFGQYYRYGYQGEYAEEDSETGWNSFQLRMYDPTILRWTSKDPAGQFWSPYLGMGNNAINNIDPDGAWVPSFETLNGISRAAEFFTNLQTYGAVTLDGVGVEGDFWTKPEEKAFRKLNQVLTTDLTSPEGRHLYLENSFVQNVKEGAPAAFDAWLALNGLDGGGGPSDGDQYGGAPFTPGFKKFPFKTRIHFRNRLAQRGSRGITAALAIETYNKGRLFYNPNTRNYIRHLTRHKISVAVTKPSGGTAITVFEGKPSPDWIPIKWRPN